MSVVGRRQPDAAEPLATGRAGRIIRDLREMIAEGEVAVGGRLPSEADLTRRYGVSRTVVREAIASLRAQGLVAARKGAGVYVLARTSQAASYRDVDYTRLSSVIEYLELRAAVEIEAAGLASLRRSPAQEEAIVEHCDAIEARMARGEPTADADFAFHRAIAAATNNGRFLDFLTTLGTRVIPRRVLQAGDRDAVPADYLRQIQDEHRAIARAIGGRDEEAARDSMRIHLKGSQARYRDLIRQNA